MWFILLPLRLSHDSSDTLSDIRLGAGEDDRIEGWDIQTLVRLTERREDDFLLGGFLERGFFHTTHV